MREFLIELIGISLPTSAIILLILAFSGMIKKRFSASCLYFIWLLVIIRLAIPFGSILLPSLIEVPVSPTVQEAPVPSDDEESSPQSAPSSDSSSIPEETPDDTGAVNERPLSDNNDDLQKGSLELDLSTIAPILFGIWATGAIAFIAADVIRYNVFAAKLKKSLMLPDKKTAALYEELCFEMNIRKPPALFISSVSQSPLLCGYFKRRMILPHIDLTRDTLLPILAHELTHHRRGDLWTKLLARFARALHWFNPLAYVAIREFEREAELSCDERVILELSEEARVLYGKTMLNIVKRCTGKESALTTKFNPSRKAARERIGNILYMRKKKRGIAIICTVAILCLAAGMLFGCEMVRKKSDPPADDEYESKTETTAEIEPEKDDTETTTAPADDTAKDSDSTNDSQTTPPPAEETKPPEETSAPAGTTAPPVVTTPPQTQAPVTPESPEETDEQGAPSFGNIYMTYRLGEKYGICGIDYPNKTGIYVIPSQVRGNTVTCIDDNGDFGQSWHNLCEMVLPDTIKCIEDWAFIYCSGLKKINLPDSITTIGKEAFECTGLESIEISNNVTVIEMGTFAECRKLKSVKLPSKLEAIKSDAFAQCSSLETITIPATCKSVGSFAFSDCTKLKSVYVYSDDIAFHRQTFEGYEMDPNLTVYAPESVVHRHATLQPDGRYYSQEMGVWFKILTET